MASQVTNKRLIEGIVVIKVSIAIGLVLCHFVPAEAAVLVSTTANLVWLFKT